MSGQQIQALAQPGHAVNKAEETDLREVIDALRLLLREGARPLVIKALTGASTALINLESEFEGVSADDRGGRRPRSLGQLVENADLHLEASIFLNIYIKLLDIYDTKFGWDAQTITIEEQDVSGSLVRGAFIRAIQMLRHLSPYGVLTIDHARLIALAHSNNEASMRRCTICPTLYLVSSNLLPVRANWTKGECPVCRRLAGIGRPRTPARVVDRARAREIYSRISGGGTSAMAVASRNS